MIHTLPRRTKIYRRLVSPAAYRPINYRLTSLAIGPIMNLELKEMQHARKQRQEVK